MGIVNDLALLKNYCSKLIIVTRHIAIISANINYRHAISCNVSIIVICNNLLIILQVILCR